MCCTGLGLVWIGFGLAKLGWILAAPAPSSLPGTKSRDYDDRANRRGRRQGGREPNNTSTSTTKKSTSASTSMSTTTSRRRITIKLPIITRLRAPGINNDSSSACLKQIYYNAGFDEQQHIYIYICIYIFYL